MKVMTSAPPKIILKDNSFTCEQIDDRYYFECRVTHAKHSISADPNITNETRLKAHWDGFRQGTRGMHYTLNSKMKDINEGLKKCKEKLRANPDVDFCQAEFTMYAINSCGERCDGEDPYWTTHPSKKDIQSMACAEDCVAVIIEATGNVFTIDDGPISERMETAVSSGDWEWITVFVK